MQLVPALTWTIAGAEPIDHRLLPLLMAIAEDGSLAAAVSRCGLSYRAAWGVLKD
jgi:molybdate transport repressor ModE-like protein